MSNDHKIPSLIGADEAIQQAPFEQEGKPVNKSCIDCEFFRSDRHHESMVCAARNIPLSNTNLNAMQLKKSHEVIAGNCDKFSLVEEDERRGRTLSKVPEFLQQVVFFPIPEIQRMPNPRGRATAPDSCNSCIFFVPRAGQDLGFPFEYNTGYCGRRNLVMASNTRNLQEIALVCTEGTTRGSKIHLSQITANARLVPEYNADYLNQLLLAEATHEAAKQEQTQEAIQAAKRENLKSNAPWAPGWEPSTHVSEFEVDEDSKMDGIRAWYSVPDPEGTGNKVIMPIFDRNFFSLKEQAKIPSSADDERPQDYVDHQGLIYNILVAWMELDETPALIGPAGTGKTEVLRTLAWMMQIPFERISITGSTELDDLQGKMLFKDGETTFQYGRLSAAWTKPNVICLDEPNVGPPEVWQFIRPLTDNSKQLVVDANSGERLIRNNNCFPGLAMNPAWDTKNIGAEFISDADSSRLLHIETRLPSWDIESKIIKHRCEIDGFEIPDILLDVLRDVSSDLRAMSDKGEIPISWGIRSQIKAARLMKWFKVERAFLQAGLSSLEPSVRDVVMDLIKTRTGDIARRHAELQRTAKMREAALKQKGEDESSGGEVQQNAAINRARAATPPSAGGFTQVGTASSNTDPSAWAGLSTGF